MHHSLTRFLQPQSTSYQTAFAEVRAGYKCSHWMWYIFPQLKGLGMSSMAHYYGINDAEEARAYLNHYILGDRLREITLALLNVENGNVAKNGWWHS